MPVFDSFTLLSRSVGAPESLWLSGAAGHVLLTLERIGIDDEQAYFRKF